MNYRRLMNFLAKGNKWQFDIPKREQVDFLSSLGVPRNDIDRSFKQYQCQMLFVSLSKRLIFNSLSIMILPIFLMFSFIRRFNSKKKHHILAIVERNTNSGVIPRSLQEKYPNLDSKPWEDGWSFGKADINFISKNLLYIFRSPYFVFKILYKGAMYSKMIKEYSPEAIVVFNEYSFTSSALTYLCESKKVKHIDVMHGEKLFYIRDAFFRFSKTYVWEHFYVDLFTKMKAPKDQFISERAPFMTIDVSKYANKAIHTDYTYYLATFNEEEIKGIIKSMDFAISQGKKVKYRPHPRYSNIELLRRHVDEHDIEYPSEINIMVSVANTDCAVGVYTTVLNQAYHSGKKVLIDDVNFPHIYGNLKELEYVLFSKPLDHLSTYQS